jgi:hypothetical protein
MHNGFFRAACLALVLASVEIALAQSLADVARAEAARRKSMAKGTAKVYTNDDLKGRDGAPAPDADPSTAATKPDTPAPAPSTATAASAGASPAAAPAPAPPPAPDPPKDEKYWRNRITAARTALQRSQAFADALQSHINGLYAEFTAMGDPIQRAGIEKKRNEAMAELDRVKADIGQQTKDIAAIEEEARRASVPSGWLR